jgi:hypothetical protein
MTEAEMFAKCDAMEGETLIAFSDLDIAMRYAEHRFKQTKAVGIIACAHDEREGSGLFVMWRDPIKPEELAKRQGNCLWLLEEILAGRQPRPIEGQATVLWEGKRQ